MKKSTKLFLVISLFITSALQAQPPGEWTWMSGDNITGQPPVWGVQGVPNPSNKPGGIYEGCEWTDASGNFWFYGGLDYNFFTQADMWMYNTTTNEWTWVNGPGGTGGDPVYGTKGVAAPTNHPGERGYGMPSWIDNSGNMWLYGGYSNANAQYLSDFWKYDPLSNMWTWMGGDTLPGAVGNHGVKGVPSPNNVPPPSTENACTWVDGDNLWFYGGMTQGGPYMGDMWKYNINSGEWTWMAGDTTVNAAPVYGTLGVSSPTNFPGARMCYSRWKALNGDFWIFGGNTSTGVANDLWKYSITTNEWTWMSGPNFTNDNGNYGTQCIASSANRPAARTECRATWTDDCGIFWLYGGSATGGMVNDLWRYNPSSDEWTWVSGPQGANNPGIYGTMGVSDPANYPGGRQGSHAYKQQNGNLWLFGGYYQGGAMINDLWRYVPDQSCGACAMVPVALFSAPNHICPGTCTDFINNSIGATSYIWNFQGANPSVSTDQNPTGICYNVPGTYSVQLIATNANTSDTLTLNNYITVYPFPPPQGINQNGDTLFAIAGAVSYQWYHNGVLVPGATDSYYLAPESGNYNVVATDNNGCEVEAVIFDVIASVENLSDENIQWMMPNPFEGEITLMFTGSVSLYDVIGQKLLEEKISSPQQTIDLSKFAKGVYFLRLITKEKTYQQQIVKQ